MAAISAPKSAADQIADLLRSRINDGTYPPGSTLPSEPQLASDFEVSRPTVNAAIVLLRNEGLLKVRRGVGTSVRSVQKIRRDARRRYAMRTRGTGAGQAEVEALGYRSRTEYRKIERVSATPSVAEGLNLKNGSPVLVRARIMWANDEPIQIANSYYPWHMVENTALQQEITGKGGSLARLAENGYPVVRFTESVDVRMPSDEERKILEIDKGTPVFDLTHIGYTTNDVPIELTYHVMPGHQWTLRYDWDE